MSTLENELQNKSQVIQQELDSLAERLMRDVDIMAAMAQEFHAPRSKSRSAFQQSSSSLDLLEVYCEEGSRLTEVAKALGLRARRFTRADGDLQTAEGQQALWKILPQYKPRRVWSGTWSLHCKRPEL